jgi:DNA-binding response OmpR family regulator
MVFNDDQDILQRYQLFLASAAYSVITHTLLPLMTPGEIASLAPDLIILDWSSGHDEGCLKLLGHVAAHPETATTPIMVCTELPPQQMHRYADTLAAHAVDVLYKPVDADTLLTTIQAHMATS